MSNNSVIHYRYNFFYIVLILVLSIVILVTTQWGAIPELLKYISFGLTLSSLIVSFLAIIFSIFSNFSFAKSAASLNDASRTITDSTKQLSEATTNIENNISNIPSLIEDVKETVKEGQERIYERIVARETPSSTDTAPTIEDDNVSKFIKRASYSGLIALFAGYLSNESKIPLIFEKIPCLQKEYSYGFLIACSSFGIITFSMKDDMFIFEKVNSAIAKDIRQGIHTKIDKVASACPADASVKEKLEKRLNEVESYFNCG